MISPIIVPMQVTTSQVQIPMSVGATFTIIAGDTYDGEMEVESKLYDSYVLETKNKLMPDDLTVRPITILDVDNPAGGYTVTLGRI